METLPVQRAVETANPPAVKRPRENDGPSAESRSGSRRKQMQHPSSFSALATGVGINSTSQSSLLLCLHALTHCTEQLRQQDNAAGREDVQLLTDIATAAGRLQRLARQRLQAVPLADTAQQLTDEHHNVLQQTSQPPQQHDLGKQDSTVQRVNSKASAAAGSAAAPQQHQGQQQRQVIKQEQQIAGESPSRKQGGQQRISTQHQQQQLSRHDNTACKAAGNKAAPDRPQSQQQQLTPHDAEGSRPLNGSQRSIVHSNQPRPQKNTAQTGALRLPPAPIARQPAALVLQQSTTGSWMEDKRPFVFQPAADAANSKNPPGATRQVSTSSRAAAALEAALAAAAADASILAVAAQDSNSSRQQQRPGSNSGQGVGRTNKAAPATAEAPSAGFHLPALKPISHLPREQLKHLASKIACGIAAPVTAANGGEASIPPAAGPPPSGSLQGKHVPIMSNNTAAATKNHLSSESGGTGTHSNSGSGTSSGTGDSSSSESSESDSDRKLPVTQLQGKLTPSRQQQQQQQQRLTASTPSPAATAAEDDGLQQCLICRKTYSADKVITSKLFSSCKHCLAAAVDRGSSRGFRLAHCPKRGCNAMVVKLGKSGWHTGDSGQAHYVDIDSRTGLFRIRYTKKVSRKKKGKSVGKGGSGGVRKQKEGKRGVAKKKS